MLLLKSGVADVQLLTCSVENCDFIKLTVKCDLNGELDSKVTQCIDWKHDIYFEGTVVFGFHQQARTTVYMVYKFASLFITLQEKVITG